MAELVREALEAYLARKPKSNKLLFLGIGRSSRVDVSEKHEELLWKEPHG